MLSFNEFLLERLGTPDAIMPYVNLVYDKCMELFNDYISRKGKFANFNVKIDIPYYEIKEVVDDESFKDFPVEDIDLKFTINVNKYGYKLAYTGYASYIHKQSKKYYYDSHWKRSRSTLVKKALNINAMVGITISKNANSIDINKAKLLIKETILHELTHIYENIKNPQFTNSPWAELSHIMQNSIYVNGSEYLYNFFWLLYKTANVEIHADISGFLSSEIYTAAHEFLDAIKDYNPEKWEQKIVKKLENLIGFDEYYKNFGNNFVETYIEASKHTESTLDPKVLKLKGKNLLEVFQHFEPYFKRKGEYFKRKVDKKITSL